MGDAEIRESGQSVTSRALSILAAFENTTGSLSVSRIAQRAHLPLKQAWAVTKQTRIPFGPFMLLGFWIAIALVAGLFS